MKFFNKPSAYILFFFSFTLIFGACRTKKALTKVEINPVDKDNEERIATIKQAQTDFTTLAIKAKALLNMDGADNDVTINFRMAKDQKMWISVTAIAGLEVARMMITPDSVFIINRLESTYIKKPFSFIANYTNQQINFGTLQSIIIGNVWNEVFTQKPTISLLDNQLQLSGRAESLAYLILFNEAFKPKSSVLEDTFTGQKLSVKYSDFFIDAGLAMPHQMKLESMVGAKLIQAELKYTKIEKDIALDFPFSVPKRFSVKN